MSRKIELGYRAGWLIDEAGWSIRSERLGRPLLSWELDRLEREAPLEHLMIVLRIEALVRRRGYDDMSLLLQGVQGQGGWHGYVVSNSAGSMQGTV